MPPSGVRQHARRIVVDDLDVGDERRTRIETFEQVVRQQGVFRRAALERRDKRIDIVKAFARKNAFFEQILIDVGDGRGVRIDTGMAGVRSSEQRPCRAGHRDADSRLQNPVASGDAAEAGIEVRTVQRMRDDPDQFFGDVARQTCVRIERDAIPY